MNRKDITRFFLSFIISESTVTRQFNPSTINVLMTLHKNLWGRLTPTSKKSRMKIVNLQYDVTVLKLKSLESVVILCDENR